VRGKFVDLDLAELADVANSFALESAEVGCDAAVLEIHNSGEGFVEETTDRLDREPTGFGLLWSVERS
jgi:prephenate dehydratase